MNTAFRLKKFEMLVNDSHLASYLGQYETLRLSRCLREGSLLMSELAPLCVGLGQALESAASSSQPKLIPPSYPKEAAQEMLPTAPERLDVPLSRLVFF